MSSGGQNSAVDGQSPDENKLMIFVTDLALPQRNMQKAHDYTCTINQRMEELREERE